MMDPEWYFAFWEIFRQDARWAEKLHTKPSSIDFKCQSGSFKPEDSSSKISKHDCILSKSTTITNIVKQPLTIDILVSVIDNMGDMGFLTELLISLKQEWLFAKFCIYTDAPHKVDAFLHLNQRLLPEYQVNSIDIYWETSSSVVFLLFHFPLPDSLTRTSHTKVIFRIDYLSFDSQWVKHHLSEHISSNEITKIYEYIPSPIAASGGLIPFLWNHTTSKSELLLKYSIPETYATKKWMTLFSYSTLYQRIDLDSCPDDICLLVLGRSQELEISWNILSLPFLPIDDFHTILSLSDFNIIRGEVSSVTAFQVWKPFLWDMYQDRGGFPEEMSQQFLDFFQMNDAYRKGHNIINTWSTGLKIPDLIQLTTNHSFSPIVSENLALELKKCIDRFYFSL